MTDMEELERREKARVQKGGRCREGRGGMKEEDRMKWRSEGGTMR